MSRTGTVPNEPQRPPEPQRPASLAETVAEALEATLGTEVHHLVRLSAGASRETWAFDTDRPLILQRRATAGATSGGTTSGGTSAGEQDSSITTSVAQEADLLRAARAAGVAVPEVVASGDGVDEPLGAPWMICERVPGESLPRTLLRDERFAGVRAGLARRCGEAIGAIHRIDPEPFVGRLSEEDQIASLRRVLDTVSDVSAVFELVLRWLELNPAPRRDRVVVHGDFRTGNLLVDHDDSDAAGLTAVLDWELTHLGNPVEDLGWFCVRAWRFGSPHRAGGFGSVEDLLAGYRAVSGEDVTSQELAWWELLGTVKWGVICAMQAHYHLSGATRSVELAAIGRRIAENEHDALNLLAELVGGELAGQAPDEVSHLSDDRARSLYGRPTAAELLEGVREFLADDVLAATEGRVRFHTRVAINVLAIVERELAAGEAPAGRHAERLAVLGVGSDEELAEAIRAGAFDERLLAVASQLSGSVEDRLSVANPGYR